MNNYICTVYHILFSHLLVYQLTKEKGNSTRGAQPTWKSGKQETLLD